MKKTLIKIMSFIFETIALLMLIILIASMLFVFTGCSKKSLCPTYNELAYDTPDVVVLQPAKLR